MMNHVDNKEVTSAGFSGFIKKLEQQKIDLMAGLFMFGVGAGFLIAAIVMYLGGPMNLVMGILTAVFLIACGILALRRVCYKNMLSIGAGFLIAAIVTYFGSSMNPVMGILTAIFLIVGGILAFRRVYYKMEFGKKTALWGVIFLLPWVSGFVLFFMVPMVRSVIFSLQDVSINPAGGLIIENIGWDNYKYILTSHATFTKQLTETVIEVALYTVLIIVFSLLCAILLNGKFVGRGIARGIFFIPVVIATGLMVERVTGVSGMMMAQSQDEKVFSVDIVANLLFSLGVGRNVVGYLTSAVGNIFEVVSMSGVQILIFLAALQGIPQQLYEVAKIEGATGYETFWKVTVVMVSPMILTCTLYTIADQFLRSDLANTISKNAISDIGKSSSMSVFFSLIVLLVIVMFIVPLKKVVFYYD